MKTEIISTGRLKYNPTYPYFCNRFMTDNEIFVNLPLTLAANKFVFDIKKTIELNSANGSLLATRLKTELGEVKHYVNFAQSLLNKLSSAYRYAESGKKDGTILPDQAAFLNAFEEVLQADDWYNLTKTSGNNNSRANNRPTIDSMDLQTLAGELWRVATKYTLNDLHKAELFVDTLNRADSFMSAKFDKNVVDFDHVAQLVVAVDQLYLEISLGTTSSAVAEQLLDLVDVQKKTNLTAAFVQMLCTIVNRQGGPAIPVPFATFDEAIRKSISIAQTYTIKRFSDSEDVQASKRDLQRPFLHAGKLKKYALQGLDGSFKTYLDLFFSMLTVKAGDVVTLGERKANTFSTLVELANYLSATNPQLSLEYPWASEMGTGSVNATAEKAIFSELYLNALLHRTSQNIPSMTASRFMSLMEERRLLREEPYSAAIKHSIQAVGTAYDAFLDVAKIVRAVIFDQNALFSDELDRLTKYRVFLSQYLSLIGKAIEGLDSPRFMFSVAQMAIDEESFGSAVPDFTLSDTDLLNRANLIVDPTDFSYFKYYINTQYTGKVFDLPIPDSTDIRLLRSPYACHLDAHYFLKRNISYSISPSQDVDTLLSLEAYDQVAATGFSKYLQNFGSPVVIGDTQTFLLQFGLPIEQFSSIFTDTVLKKLEEHTPVVFFEWNSNATQYIAIEDVFTFYEIGESTDLFGNPSSFVGEWPFVVKSQIEGTSMPLKSADSSLIDIVTSKHQEATEAGSTVETADGGGLEEKDTPVTTASTDAEELKDADNAAYKDPDE